MYTRKKSRNRCRPVTERLDGRCVPATTVGLTATLAGGVLTIVGTEGSDQIALAVTNPVTTRSFRRMAVPKGPLLVVPGAGSFRLNQVARVQIGAGGGDDLVVIDNGGQFTAPVAIDGSTGNDSIVTGNGPATVYGGPGNDIIVTRGPVASLSRGTGADWINGQVIQDPPATPAPSTPTPPPVSPPINVPPTSPDLAAWATKIVDLTNQQRQLNGLAPLSVSAKLTQAAQIQANQMASSNTMEHTLPNARYPDLVSRAKAVGYSYSWLGENIAFNYPDPEGVVKGWMLSEGHRKNILFADYTEIGVAVALDANGRPYFAQEFGRPA
jgi:uncharacterized protein YkwD